MFLLNQASFKIKFLYQTLTYISNTLFISTLGALLALVGLRRATSSWKMVLRLALKFPPLVLLPMCGFVTFGPTPQGGKLHSLDLHG